MAKWRVYAVVFGVALFGAPIFGCVARAQICINNCCLTSWWTNPLSTCCTPGTTVCLDVGGSGYSVSRVYVEQIAIGSGGLGPCCAGGCDYLYYGGGPVYFTEY